MTILYVTTRVLTLFGTQMRTLWELIVCRLYKIPVEDVRAFKSSELCGHVEHELTTTLSQSFLMCFLPFICNFLLGSCLLMSGAYRLVYVGDVSSLLAWLYMWLGVSLYANCIPSFEDVLSFRDHLYTAKRGLALKILLAPHFGIVYAGAFLERFSLTLPLAIAAAIGFPYVMTVLFPFFRMVANS